MSSTPRNRGLSRRHCIRLPRFMCMNDNTGIGLLFGLPFVVLLLGWLIIAGVAAVVAPDDRKGTFFLITFFFLGPLGIAAAAIAQPRPQRRPLPGPAWQQPSVPDVIGNTNPGPLSSGPNPSSSSRVPLAGEGLNEWFKRSFGPK